MLPTDLAVLLANPFTQERWPAALARFSLGGARTSIEAALGAGAVADAEGLLLAAATARACRGEPRLLDAQLISQAALKQLPRPPGDYIRVAAAAARCMRALVSLAGHSQAMRKVRERAFAACFGQSLVHALSLSEIIHDHDVLVLGETGTGKEGVARAICEGTLGDGQGNPAPTGAINAASLPESLLASELFGHVRGAFTGATADRPGRLRAAQGGSFFLDEVGDLPETTQVNLLRVIETDEVSPLGSERSFAVKLRYVSATHKDLGRLVEEGRFRQDLYERMAGLVIHLPPLRERPEDIPEIGRALMDHYVPSDHPARAAGEAFLERVSHEERVWRGNVRELQNQLRNVLLGLPPEGEVVTAFASPTPRHVVPLEVQQGRATLAHVQSWYTQLVLSGHDGNVAQAARTLGIDRNTVARKLGRRPGAARV